MLLLTNIKTWTLRYPLISFILLCFGFTWSVWFCVPFIAGTDWALGKIVVGAGFGPALAAISLDHLRGNGGKLGTRKWWLYFSISYLILAVIYFSVLITGDSLTAEKFATAQPVGFSLTGILVSLASAAVGSFIIASLACSHSKQLNSLFHLRVSIKWWLIALFLPAGWMLLGIAVAYATDSTIAEVNGGLAPLPWALYVFRSVLFTLLVVAVGEEAGWRAWMLPELQKRFSPLVSSIFLGIVWGLWHYPLFVIGQYPDPPEMVFAKVGVCIMLGIMFTWLYNRSNGSLLMVVILHTAMNSTARLIPFTEQMGIFLFAAFISMLILDRMWRRRDIEKSTSEINA